MVLRRAGEGVVCIGQPAHAWVSGQLARAWSPAPEPREEVCLAAVQHDLGMAGWDAAPTLNPETGFPHSFLEMPLATHLELWSRAPRLAASQSRYAALLVSLHGTALYRRRDLDREPPEAAAAIRAFLDGQHALQEQLLDSLRADPAYAPHATEEAVRRNQRLLFAWDWMSLVLCMDRLPATVEDLDLRMAAAPAAAGPCAVTVDPWPIAGDSLTVRVDGRVLAARFDDEDAMRAALDAAGWVTLDFRLVPAG
jgi:hypothetical protein